MFVAQALLPREDLMRAVRRTLSIVPVVAGAVAVAFLAPAAAVADPSPIVAAAQGTPRTDVIVLMSDQHGTTPTSRSQRLQRAKTVRASQSAIVDDAQRLGARDVHQYGVINAVSANVTAATATALARQPGVAAVVPDRMIARSTAADSTAKPGSATSRSTTSGDACPTDPAKPLLEPEGLQSMRVAYDDSTVGANSLSTGAGVRVAYLADGVDVNNPDFIRDGKSVFVDYQDFSTEGWNAQSSGAEAFGDASAIAAQGNRTYSLADVVSPAHPLPADCTVRIQGVAPGADLVGLKVFGNAPYAPVSRFIQAIEYAVNVADVDVINESFGSDPYPDTEVDPISMINTAAIEAGTTVVVGTGDAGLANTIGSPASAKDVISVGASTQFRWYAQTTYGGYNLPGVTGWANDNISAISSGGFAQNGRIPDLVAPGDTTWALCTPDPTLYRGCIGLNGRPSSLEPFAGASASAPLAAGAAALVISAYVDAHPGAGKPSPALVKRLLTSTARDLGHPAELQGAGQIDALAAVRAALSVPAPGSNVRPPAAQGTALLVRKSQLTLTGRAGSTVTATVKVRNISSRTQTLSASSRSLTKTLSKESGTIAFDGSSLPTIANVVGAPRAYSAKTFTVKPDTDRLQMSLAYAGAGTSVGLALVDPNGVYQGYSQPQAAANFASVGVRYPAPGTWTAYLIANPAYTGEVQFGITTSAAGSFGSVSGTTIIPAGRTGTLTYSVGVPADPGDTAGSLQLSTALGVRTSVPISLRSVLRASGQPVEFRGVVGGGNGRTPGGVAQSNTYYLHVPHGAPSLSVGVVLGDQPTRGTIYNAYLVSPSGHALSSVSNVRTSAAGPVTTGGVQLYANHPAAGRWRMVLEATNPVAGTVLGQPFTGTVSLAAQPVSAYPNLPNSPTTTLAAGETTTALVRVTNTGVVPLTYFADARRQKVGTYPLASQVPGNDLSAITLPQSAVSGAWLVPPHTSTLSFGADATQPVQLDARWAYGDPEIFGESVGNRANAAISADQVTPGPWLADAGVIGPFSGPAPAGTVAYRATATTRLFDDAVATTTGDFWRTALVPAPAADPAPLPLSVKAGAPAPTRWSKSLERLTAADATALAGTAPDAQFEPLTLEPGESGTILVAITPPASSRGDVRRGTLFIDTFDAYKGTGTEVAGIPYAYLVK